MISTQSTVSKPRKPPKVRTIQVSAAISSDSSSSKRLGDIEQVDVETQTSDDSQAVIEELKGRVTKLEEVIVASKFCIENVAKDQLITFYTGFPSYESLKACQLWKKETVVKFE